MNCTFCGHSNETATSLCERCGAALPEPSCEQCGVAVAWGTAVCEDCGSQAEGADQTPCPSCSVLNTESAEYCTSCGSPMAVITKVVTLARARDREPLETWRVYGIETRMVGRQAELARLQHWHDDAAKTGLTRIVSVVGPTGLGKSRLLAEFQRQLDLSFSESVVLQAACRDEAGGPYAVFARLLKNRFYIAEQDSPSTASRKFEEAVAALVDDGDAARRIRGGAFLPHLLAGDATFVRLSAR